MKQQTAKFRFLYFGVKIAADIPIFNLHADFYFSAS